MFKTRAAELRFRVINFTDVILCTVINTALRSLQPRTLPRLSRAHLDGQKFEADNPRR